MRNKLIIVFGIIMAIVLCVLLAIFEFCQFDENKDGKKDFRAYTNLVSLIREYDFDRDGIYDLKEYVSFRTKIIKSIKVLNKKYDNIRVIENFKDGRSCTVTISQNCEIKDGNIVEIRWERDGKILRGVAHIEPTPDK